jgi:hypothetical protein
VNAIGISLIEKGIKRKNFIYKMVENQFNRNIYARSNTASIINSHINRWITFNNKRIVNIASKDLNWIVPPNISHYTKLDNPDLNYSTARIVETLDTHSNKVIFSDEITLFRNDLKITNPDIQPWDTLLKCALPKEIRYTTWRLLMGVLPINRGIPCPHCNQKISNHHLFWECDLAKNLSQYLQNTHPSFDPSKYSKINIYEALCSTDLLKHPFIAPALLLIYTLWIEYINKTYHAEENIHNPLEHAKGKARTYLVYPILLMNFIFSIYLNLREKFSFFFMHCM